MEHKIIPLFLNYELLTIFCAHLGKLSVGVKEEYSEKIIQGNKTGIDIPPLLIYA